MAKPILNSTGIRTDLVTRLKAASTPAGQRVYDSRLVAFEPGDIPAIAVFSVGGTEAKWSKNTLLNKHTERVQVTGFVTNEDEAALGAALDTMADAIIDNLLGDGEWVSAFEAVDSTKIEKWQPDTQVRFPLMAVTVTLEMTYSVKYEPASQAPFETVHLTTAPTDPDGADVSAREIQLEQEA